MTVLVTVQLSLLCVCVPCSCLLPELVLQQSVGTSYTSTEDDFIIVSLDFGFQNLWCLIMVKEETNIDMYTVYIIPTQMNLGHTLSTISFSCHACRQQHHLHEITVAREIWNVKRLCSTERLYAVYYTWCLGGRDEGLANSFLPPARVWPVSSLGHGAVAWTPASPATGPAPPHTRTQHCRSHLCHCCHGFNIHRM